MKFFYYILIFLLTFSFIACNPKQKKRFGINHNNVTKKGNKRNLFNNQTNYIVSEKTKIQSNSNVNFLVSSVKKKVDNFNSAVDNFNNSDSKRGISAAEVAKFIENANDLDAVNFCVEITMLRKCKELEKLIEIYEQFLKRGLSETHRGTILQMICLVELQRKNFEGIIKKIDDILKEEHNDNMSGLIELLNIKEIALNNLNRKADAMAVLEEQLRIARNIGKPKKLINSIEAKLAHAKGEYWENFDPEGAERKRFSQKMRNIGNQYAVQKFNQMSCEKKEKLLNKMKNEIDNVKKNKAMKSEEKKKLLSELNKVINVLTTNNKETK